MHNFRELFVWKKARIFVKDIYVLTSNFPKEEIYGLTSQLKRASISIPLNIAEGSGRTDKEFIHFLRIARSSAFEVETILYLCLDLSLISENVFNSEIQKVVELQKMISGLMNKIK